MVTSYDTLDDALHDTLHGTLHDALHDELHDTPYCNVIFIIKEDFVMIYTLKNDKLTVGISPVGAQVASAISPDGCEYIWQADPAFWGKHGPVLFPICSSLFEGKYTYKGKTYEMGKHGFAKLS